MEEIRNLEVSENSEARSNVYSLLIGCKAVKGFDPSIGSKTDINLRGKPPPTYRPYQFFDYVGGSSTRILIALMLGRMSMSADNDLISYQKFPESIAGSSMFRI